MNWKFTSTSLVLYVFLACTATAAEEGYRSLFDGHSFKGWEGDTNKSFRIENGAIIGGTLDARVPRNEFLCTTERFSNFILKLECKLIGDGANAGIQFRTERIPDHHEVIGYQADMGEGWWGSLYDESRRRKILAKADPAVIERVLKKNDWNDYVIHCQGPRIRLYINGEQTVDYTEPDPDIPRTGLVALQIHGGPPSQAFYRNIRIKELAEE